MMTPEERDELLWASIEAGALDDSAAADTEIVARFVAHQKLESLFAMLREPSTLGDPLDQPSQIGRYRVEKALGEGAFGRVYLAHDPELDRLVAVKMPRADVFSSEQDADHFLGEAKLAASLNHPGIVTIHDAGREGRSCFIVMGYVEGRSLQEVMDAGELPHKQAAELVACVADALHYAHKRGFVHRDLKPGNILVDDQGQPHVADFGLAVSEEDQRLHAGQVAGTPAYMSPEQVRGETQHLDGRTDIWSLGVIFYHLLTGRHPFWRGDPAECLDAIQHREPKPPRQINDRVPADLEKVCLRCLSKDISHRYSTAADLACAMRKLSRRRKSSLESAFLRWPPARWLLLGAVCASLALVIGILLRRPARDLEHAGEKTPPPEQTLHGRDAPSAREEIPSGQAAVLFEDGLGDGTDDAGGGTSQPESGNHAKRRAAQVIVFDFDSGLGPNFSVLNTGNLWTVDTDGQNVRFSKPADDGTFYPDGIVAAQIASRFTVAGDFTVTVDFTLHNFPRASSANGRPGGVNDSILMAISSGGFFEVLRLRRGDRNEIGVWVKETLLGTKDSAVKTGRYRIERAGSTVTGLFARGGSSLFVLLATVDGLSGPMRVVLLAQQAGGSLTGGRSTSAMDISFDNLIVEADHIEGYIP